MIHITAAGNRHSKELGKLLQSEWAEIDPYKGPHGQFQVPPPFVALDDHDNLAGGLAFTSFAKPKHAEPAIWINAVLVVPEYRRLATASNLIVCLRNY